MCKSVKSGREKEDFSKLQYSRTGVKRASVNTQKKTLNAQTFAYLADFLIGMANGVERMLQLQKQPIHCHNGALGHYATRDFRRGEQHHGR
jgi:hypothetical protein